MEKEIITMSGTTKKTLQELEENLVWRVVAEMCMQENKKKKKKSRRDK